MNMDEKLTIFFFKTSIVFLFKRAQNNRITNILITNYNQITITKIHGTLTANKEKE